MIKEIVVFEKLCIIVYKRVLTGAEEIDCWQNLRFETIKILRMNYSFR